MSVGDSYENLPHFVNILIQIKTKMRLNAKIKIQHKSDFNDNLTTCKYI